MKKRTIVTAVALCVCGVQALALLGACASDEAETPPPDAPNVITAVEDAGADAEAARAEVDAGPCVDCEYFPETCSPEDLCAAGLFDPNQPQGGAETLDLRTQINAIVGRGPSDVWAIGNVGAMAHFDGTSWKRLGPVTQESLRGIWLRPEGEIAFGSKLNHLFLHGVDPPDAGEAVPSEGDWAMLAPLPMPPIYMFIENFSFTSVWGAAGAEWAWCGLATNDPYASAASGLWRIRRLPDATFEIQTGMACHQPCDGDGITSLHGASKNVVWAVGAKGSAFRIADADGPTTRPKAFNSLTWNRLQGVWAVSDSEAWAVGTTGTIRHFTDGEATAEIVSDVPSSMNLRAVWGTSSSDIWAVGDASAVLHYDGKRWARVKVAGLGARRPDLSAVWMSSSGHVWVGGQGILLSLGGRP